MRLEFDYLVDRPDAVPGVIRWWHTVWADRMGSDLDALESQLRQSLGKDALPVHILALVDGRPVGTAVLKKQELPQIYPDRHYWLGSVYVDTAFRQDGIASRLTQRVVEMAEQRGLPHLHLQTSRLSGGLYARLGWQPLERFTYHDEQTLLMVRQLP